MQEEHACAWPHPATPTRKGQREASHRGEIAGLLNVEAAGIEPATSSLWMQRLYQLGYRGVGVEPPGIDPRPLGCEPSVLPLNHGPGTPVIVAHEESSQRDSNSHPPEWLSGASPFGHDCKGLQ